MFCDLQHRKVFRITLCKVENGLCYYVGLGVKKTDDDDDDDHDDELNNK